MQMVPRLWKNHYQLLSGGVTVSYTHLIGDLKNLLQEELNIKEVQFEHDLQKYMNFQLKPNFKVAGPVMGSNIRAFSEYLSKMDNEEFLAHDIFKVTLGSENFEVTKDMVDVKITAKEGLSLIHI